jgi:hypothetical protein
MRPCVARQIGLEKAGLRGVVAITLQHLIAKPQIVAERSWDGKI